MSNPPLYPQFDPKEVQQAHQFNLVHQPPSQNSHTFIQSPNQPQNYPFPAQNYNYQQPVVPSNYYASSQPHPPNASGVHQAQHQYYYQPQQINTYPTTYHNPQIVQQQPTYQHLYQTQQHYQPQQNPVQPTAPLQPHPPAPQHLVHSSQPTTHPQVAHEAPKHATPPQQLSDEEPEDDEIETASSVITTDRKLARLLARIERNLKRLQLSIMKRNRTGTARSKEILEESIVEIQSYHIADAEERAAVHALVQRIQLATKHAAEELELMEQDRQRQLTQYRNAVLELKKEAEQAQHLLESDLDQQTQDIIHQVQQQQRQT